MFKRSTLIALGAFVAMATAAAAQMSTDKMSGDHMARSMRMSKMQMKTMHSCKAMSHDMMMKSAKCAKMMKMHPEMMGDSGAMAPK